MHACSCIWHWVQSCPAPVPSLRNRPAPFMARKRVVQQGIVSRRGSAVFESRHTAPASPHKKAQHPTLALRM